MFVHHFSLDQYIDSTFTMSSFILEYDHPQLEAPGQNAPSPRTLFEPHPFSRYPPHPDIPDSISTSKIILRKYITCGRVWDFYEATPPHSTYGKVCVKLINIDRPPRSLYREYDLDEPPIDPMDSALNEEYIYMNALKGVQGPLVPLYYGLFASGLAGSDARTGHLAMLLGWGGEGRGRFGSSNTDEYRSKLYAVYEQLHLLGIMHGDIEPRHILFSSNREDEGGMQLRLCSFRRSVVKDLTNQNDVGDLMEEAGFMRSFLGYQDLEKLNMLTELPRYWEKMDPDDVEDMLSYYEPPEEEWDDWVVVSSEGPMAKE